MRFLGKLYHSFLQRTVYDIKRKSVSNVTTGQRMKQRRKELGLSAEAIAEALGISPATIYRYENGAIDKVPGDRLAPIAKVLKTSPAYLM